MTEALFPRSSLSATENIDAAREELRKRLPELRELPGFPNGSDEDILKMSLPPAYTACPNPFIEDWLKASEPEGYGEAPYVDPGPYAADISVGKSHPIYQAHSYPTKVPHQAIMRYILHYTRPGDVVLDGFCGTGMTGVAAEACGNPEAMVRAEIEGEFATDGRKPAWGSRRAVLQDISPSATFIAGGLNLPIDADAFDTRSKEILEWFNAEWGWMYETTHTNGKTKARIDYTVWSEVFTCPHCGGEVVFYEVAFNETAGRMKDDFACPDCGAGVSKKTLERRKVPVTTLAGDTIERIEFRPVKIHYRIGKKKLSKDPDQADVEVIRKIRSVNVPWFPTVELPLKEMTHGTRLGPKGFTRVHHLYSDRALASLALIWDEASHEPDPLVRAALLFWIEQAAWGLSWMVVHSEQVFSMVNQYRKGIYYVSSQPGECSLDYYLGARQKSYVKALRRGLGAACVSTASSTSLGLPGESVDYVFIDPPFGWNIPYADLGVVGESWHRVREAPKEEAIIDRLREKALPEYQALMEACFLEFHRVLRPGRWMTVEFNNSSNQVWATIQEALSLAGFVVADTRVFDKGLLSFRQVTAKNIVKRDLIISAYKPAHEMEERFSLVAGTEDGAWEFIHEHLSHLPIIEGKRGQALVVRERQADRLYDRMVAYHVYHGTRVPLTASEFYAGLEQRLPVRDDMYFLPEQVEAYERHRMTFKELAQTELFITNESSAVAWLRQQLRANPQTFAEIQPSFFAELQAGLPDWEQLPDLRTLLDDSFLQDDQDRWYVPDPKKASDLNKLRTRALLKDFEVYTQSKGKLVKFRSEAVRTGFKEAWGRQDYGLIANVGDRLPDEVFADDPSLLMYYDNAKRLRS